MVLCRLRSSICIMSGPCSMTVRACLLFQIASSWQRQRSARQAHRQVRPTKNAHSDRRSSLHDTCSRRSRAGLFVTLVRIRIVILASIAVSVSLSFLFPSLSLVGQVLLGVSALWSLFNLLLLHSVPEFQRNDRGMLAKTKKMLLVFLLSFIVTFPLLCTTSNLLGLSPFADNAARSHQPSMVEFVKAPSTLSDGTSTDGTTDRPLTHLAAVNEDAPVRTDDGEDQNDGGDSLAGDVAGAAPTVSDAGSPESAEVGAARAEDAADQGAAVDSAIVMPEPLDSQIEAPLVSSREEASIKLEDTQPVDQAEAPQLAQPEGGFAEARINPSADEAGAPQAPMPGFASVLPGTERQDGSPSTHSPAAPSAYLVDDLAPPQGGFVQAGIGPRSAEAGIVGGAGTRAAEPSVEGSVAAPEVERASAHESPLARLERQRREVIAGIKRQLMRGSKRGARSAQPWDAVAAASGASRGRLQTVAGRAARGAAAAGTSALGVPAAGAARFSMDKISNALRAARRTRRAQDPDARVEPRDGQPASEQQASLMSDSKGDGADTVVNASPLVSNADSTS